MSNINQKKVLIVGAGPVGCVMAERIATQMGWEVTIIDKREHIAGNCYDKTHESGVLVHQYGPHYFRTNKKEIIDYLSQYTNWVEGNYFVTSNANGEFYPFPINLLTLAQFFKTGPLTPEEGARLLETKRVNISNPKNSEEFVLSRVGHEMYETFYLGYTLKQWGIHPRDLAPSVCGRIPVRFNTDCRYVDHQYQLTPAEGFTELFRRMIDNPKIKVQLNTDFNDIRDTATKDFDILIYTGPIDEYFNFEHGKLAWRSLQFDFRTYQQEYVQDNVQINYPNEHDYTRTVEIKHVTRQKHPHTVVVYEYPKAEGDPYYPIPTDDNHELYEKYRRMAEHEAETKNVYYCGRLAEYKYFNTDEVIENALKLFEIIKQKHGNK